MYFSSPIPLYLHISVQVKDSPQKIQVTVHHELAQIHIR